MFVEVNVRAMYNTVTTKLKYISSLCVLYQSCRLEPSFWNIVALVISPIPFHTLTLLVKSLQGKTN